MNELEQMLDEFEAELVECVLQSMANFPQRELDRQHRKHEKIKALITEYFSD